MLCLSASGVFAQKSEIWKVDVPTWLDGCVTLATNSYSFPMSMEADCLGLASKYCSMGRKFEEAPTCHNALREKLLVEADELNMRLEHTGSELTGNRSVRFERSLRHANTPEKSDVCPATITATECELMGAGSRWMLLRSLARRNQVEF